MNAEITKGNKTTLKIRIPWHTQTTSSIKVLIPEGARVAKVPARISAAESTTPWYSLNRITRNML